MNSKYCDDTNIASNATISVLTVSCSVTTNAFCTIFIRHYLFFWFISLLFYTLFKSYNKNYDSSLCCITSSLTCHTDIYKYISNALVNIAARVFLYIMHQILVNIQICVYRIPLYTLYGQWAEKSYHWSEIGF